MNLWKVAVVCLPLTIFAGNSFAQDYASDVTAGSSAAYFGGGKQRKTGDYESDSTPFAIGFMHQRAGGKGILGFDIAREGTMIDSTYRRDEEVRPATSFNLIAGRNFQDNGQIRVDGALLIGARQTVADCPDSYLGYQCYADRTPDTKYKVNFGALLAVSYDRMLLGVRASGESTQLIAGFRF